MNPLCVTTQVKATEQYFRGLFVNVLQNYAFVFQYFSFQLGHPMDENEKDCLVQHVSNPS